MAGKKATTKPVASKAPTKGDLDAMPPGVAMALADRYGIKGYERPEATIMEEPPPADPPA